ncbi:Uncharacterised protein [uncultured archaeon]|nr:Uncharacterised protein [uncultured archaeon]
MMPIIPTPEELRQNSKQCKDNLINKTYDLPINGSNLGAVVGSTFYHGKSYEKLMARGILCSEHAAEVLLNVGRDLPKDVIHILLQRLSMKIGEYGERPHYHHGPKELMWKSAVFKALQEGKFGGRPNLNEMLTFESDYLEGKRPGLKTDMMELSSLAKEKLLVKRFWFASNETNYAKMTNVAEDAAVVLEKRKRDLRAESVDVLFGRLDGIKKEIAIRIMEDNRSKTHRPNIYRKAEQIAKQVL